jgi:hypothetical protein
MPESVNYWPAHEPSHGEFIGTQADSATTGRPDRQAHGDPRNNPATPLRVSTRRIEAAAHLLASNGAPVSEESVAFLIP